VYFYLIVNVSNRFGLIKINFVKCPEQLFKPNSSFVLRGLSHIQLHRWKNVGGTDISFIYHYDFYLQNSGRASWSIQTIKSTLVNVCASWEWEMFLIEHWISQILTIDAAFTQYRFFETSIKHGCCRKNRFHQTFGHKYRGNSIVKN